MLDGEDFVHAFEAEPAFFVEKIGDVGLFKSGLLRQPETGQFTCIDTIPKYFPEIILQDFELHGPEYSTGIQDGAQCGRFPQAALVYTTLTEKIHSYTIAAS